MSVLVSSFLCGHPKAGLTNSLQIPLLARTVPRPSSSNRLRLSTKCTSLPKVFLASTSQPSKVAGLGSVGLDYLAQVVQFPKPDEKIRTTQMEVASLPAELHVPVTVQTSQLVLMAL